MDYDYENMTAPCGLACFNCVVHLAKKDPDLREAVAKQFNVPKEQVSCDGCRNVKGKCPVMPESNCKVYSCSQKKGIKFCCNCSDFPCDNFHPYADQANNVPHNTKVFNLCLIKKMGLTAWIEKKSKNVTDTYFNGKWEL